VSSDNDSPPVQRCLWKQSKKSDNVVIECQSPPIERQSPPIELVGDTTEDHNSLESGEASSDGEVVVILPFTRHVKQYTATWDGFFEQASTVSEFAWKLWTVGSIPSLLLLALANCLLFNI
jgi:hypothetical protein